MRVLHKNTRGLSTLGYGQYYLPRFPLSNDKKFNRARLRHLNKNFYFLITCLILRTYAILFGGTEGEGVGGEVSETS